MSRRLHSSRQTSSPRCLYSILRASQLHSSRLAHRQLNSHRRPALLSCPSHSCIADGTSPQLHSSRLTLLHSYIPGLGFPHGLHFLAAAIPSACITHTDSAAPHVLLIGGTANRSALIFFGEILISQCVSSTRQLRAETKSMFTIPKPFSNHPRPQRWRKVR